jgi:hypothetical protein
MPVLRTDGLDRHPIRAKLAPTARRKPRMNKLPFVAGILVLSTAMATAQTVAQHPADVTQAAPPGGGSTYLAPPPPPPPSPAALAGGGLGGGGAAAIALLVVGLALAAGGGSSSTSGTN